MTQPSKLWGENGELWTPSSRLPDFSHAGYHNGEAPIPDLPPGISVRDFGAKGDGKTDETAAFIEALASVSEGVLEVPEGRYVLTDVLTITRPNVVLRGAGSDRAILYFPRTLQEIHPNWGATTTGEQTSNYSWSGGFIRIEGSFGGEDLVGIIGEAARGEAVVRVSDATLLQIGQRIDIVVSDTPHNSLASELYGGDPGNTSKLRGSTTAHLTCRITGIDGDRVSLDRPLRFPLRPEWNPRIRRFAPTITESGIEHLGFEFPVTPYKGHFTEWGYNAVALENVADCWVRDLRIVNADSGLFPNGRFCTIQGIVFESERPPDSERNSTGHHGIYFGGDDNLFTDFDFRTPFIHDITVSHCAGNVIANGHGVDLCFDHHKRAPYENLFTDLDAGAGTRLWMCGGGADLGRHCAARGTFWNIRTQQPQEYPPPAFGPPSMNLVAVTTEESGETLEDGRWFEAIPTAEIRPQDIYGAQLRLRIGQGEV